MVIFPLAPDQTIAQMWSNGARGGSLVAIHSIQCILSASYLVWFDSMPIRFTVGIFTARCTLVQSAVLRSHVVCLSVCPSVTLVNCDHTGWNSSKIISPSVSLGCSLFATPT